GGYSGAIHLDLEYTGAPTVDYRGIKKPAGAKVQFGFQTFVTGAVWKVTTFNFDKATADPRTQYEAWKQASKKGTTADWNDIDWSGRFPNRSLGRDYAGLIAESTFKVPAGQYDLETNSDDGVRVWVDDKLVIDNWTYHGPTIDKAKLNLSNDPHKFRVEYFQLDGWAALSVILRPH
ncbi:MAG: PA14 domain-containing protein, partial [Armatimonadota bacterium]